MTKNQRKRLNARKKKQAAAAAAAATAASAERGGDAAESGAGSDAETASAAASASAAALAGAAVTVEYVSASAPGGDDPAFSEFAAVFDKFLSPETLTKTKEQVAEEAAAAARAEEAAAKAAEDALHSDSENDSDGGGGGGAGKLSRRKRRLAARLSVAELKQLVARPEVVEAQDATATDPRLLVHLKAYRNTVEVPRHWCQKRKYLQGKRGIEKPPFALPDFIQQTGISRVRGADDEAPVDKKLKNIQRSRMAPKLGKIDIDYQVLHDAFFRYQTKPKLTKHGELYYEGKEFETKTHSHVPGVLSAELKAALGMPEGAGSGSVPPPWLINMQRYGPPPSYPALKIPGLSAPIPAGASFGYHPGGWGKPPVDEFGRPLYGDVFGTGADAAASAEVETGVDKLARWGELEPEPESEEEEEDAAAEDEDMDEGEGDDAVSLSGMETPLGSEAGGIVTPGGGTGMDTPASEFELRKGGTESVSSMGSAAPPQLYKVLEQKEARVSGSSLMGSSHAYALPTKSGVDVALDADELEQLDEEGLRLKYQEGVEARQAGREDMSDLVADQNKKRKRAQEKKASKKQKDKEFKF